MERAAPKHDLVARCTVRLAPEAHIAADSQRRATGVVPPAPVAVLEREFVKKFLDKYRARSLPFSKRRLLLDSAPMNWRRDNRETNACDRV